MFLRNILVVTLINILLNFDPVFSADAKIPVDLQAKFFLASLTFAKNLKQKAGDKLRIGIVYFSDVSSSNGEALKFSQALEEFKGKKVMGLSFDKVLVAYNSNKHLKDEISRDGIHVLYIVRGRKKVIMDIAKLTKSEKILSYTSIADYVTSCGVTMAIGVENSKPKIYLNLTSARAEGVDFSSRILRVSKIIGEDKK